MAVSATARRFPIRELLVVDKTRRIWRKLGHRFTECELKEQIRQAVWSYDSKLVATLICTLSPNPGPMTLGDMRRKLQSLLLAVMLEQAKTRYVKKAEGFFQLTPVS